MNKKSKKAPVRPGDFQSSDFMGADPKMQAELSASLNTLSRQLAMARETLAAAAPRLAAELPDVAEETPLPISPVRRRGPGDAGAG